MSSQGTGSGANNEERRRERRVVFTRQCRLIIQSPVWAITTKPLQGRTENITSLGLRVTELSPNPGQAKAWQETIKRDQEIRAEVFLPELPSFPRIKGNIVWVKEFEGDSSRGIPITCAVGILFSIMKEQEMKAIKKLISVIEKDSS